MLIKLPFTKSARAQIVHAAEWLVDHRAGCTYSEGNNRMICVSYPYVLPFVSDCSSGIECLYSWGNANDPSGNNFEGDPYTGTLVAHGRLISARRARSADVGILGPDTGWHAVLVVSGGRDPLVWSMGEQGDPRLYRMSVVEQAVAYVNHVPTCQVRYFRYDTSLRSAAAVR
jgi:hypothetical protein